MINYFEKNLFGPPREFTFREKFNRWLTSVVVAAIIVFLLASIVAGWAFTAHYVFHCWLTPELPNSEQH